MRKGPTPAQALATVKKRIRITKVEALALVELQKGRILKRLDNGVDIDGKDFAPYSSKPYYYAPRTGARLVGSDSESTIKADRGAVKRLWKKVTGRAFDPKEAKDDAPRPSKTGRSIFFPLGYRQFKEWLGRTPGLVDLTGPRAPHMRQTIAHRVTAGESLTIARSGIYGDAAGRANGHQTGAGRLPRRHWFGLSQADIKQVAADLKELKK